MRSPVTTLEPGAWQDGTSHTSLAVFADRAVGGEPADIGRIQDGRLATSRPDGATDRRTRRCVCSSRRSRRRPGNSRDSAARRPGRGSGPARPARTRRTRRWPATSASTGDAAMRRSESMPWRRRAVDLLGGQAEDEDVVVADTLDDLDIRAVQRADGQRAVQGELHVAGAGRFHPGRGDLLRQVGRRDDDFGQADDCSSAGRRF